MKYFYKFNNLLGAVYKKGNLQFSYDGNSVISAVGNRISIFDLKNNKANTLPIESRFNYTALALSPNGCTLIAINEEGEAHMISLISQTIVHKYRFKGKVRAVQFSPDGKHFAVCKESNVFVFKAPGSFNGEYNAFVMERVFHGALDETTCLSWSFDSRILAAGSKDMATKLYPLEKWKNFRICSLGNHTDIIVKSFFEEDTYDMITISRNGQMCVWECSINPTDLVPLDHTSSIKKSKLDEDLEEDDIDVSKSLEASESEVAAELKRLSMPEEELDKPQAVEKLFYKRLARHYLADEIRKEDRDAILTAADYHTKTKILLTGFSNGSFFLHELPDVNLVHSLKISDQKVSAVSFNNTGDWIALGCQGLGQLLVWEWQSETYVLKQQSHANNMCCVAYSTDGQLIATGGEDGKVKLWNVVSGFCFVTFTEHSNAVNAISFSGNKKFVVSASLDGTVRAYDIIRYRNFRTFTSLQLVQFSCVAVDITGEFVAAGAQDAFEIFLWSVKTGKLLEILSGHEGPVSSVAFSTSLTSCTLASASWDKTLRIWDAIEKGSAHETIQINSDCLCVVFKPDGQEVAVSTLNCHILVFDVKTGSQTASIEGRDDLGSGRSDTDLITAKKSLQAKAFTTLCYSADGECLLAGGQSKNICIYNVKEGLLLKKFVITQNRSLDAVDDFINRRKMTDFGNLALVEEREEREGGNTTIKLPGVRRGDMASRAFKPEVRVFSVQFSPTGQQWVAATTEGLLVYSLGMDQIFDPWNLDVDITPQKVKELLKKADYLNALSMAVKLNQPNLILEVIEHVPVKDVELILGSLSIRLVERLLVVLSGALEASRHLEFYLLWTQHILTIHGPNLKIQANMPALLALEKSLINRQRQLSKICDYNKYTLQYVSNLGEVHSKQAKLEISSENEDNLNIDSLNDVLMLNNDR